MTLPMSEAAWQRRVLEAARLHRWRAVHIRPARTARGNWVTPYEGDPGLPDLILARDGVVLLAELKLDKGSRWMPGQQEWLAAAGQNGRLWTPNSWDQVLEELT